MVDKIFNDKRRIYTFIVIAILMFSVFLGLHQNVIYDSYEYKMPANVEQIEDKNILEIYNYEREGNRYIPNGELTYIKIVSDKNIGSVKLNVNCENVDEETDFKIYYSENDNFNEAQTITQNISENSSDILVNIPSEDIKFLRITINSEFVLNSCEISENHMTLQKVSSSESNYFVFCIVDLIVSITIAALMTINNIFQRFINWIKKVDKKVFLVRSILYIFSIACILGIQVIFTNQFVIKMGNRYIVNIMRLSFSVMLVTLFWGLIWLRKNFKNNLEKIFLLISLSVGITFAIATPMLQESTWDAGIHYGNTIELVYFDQNELPAIDKQVGWLEYSYNLKDLGNIQDKYDANYFYTSGTVETRTWSIVGLYNVIGYLPHALGIFVARGLSLSFTTSVLMGKIFSNIFYSIIVYYAIKRLNTGKLVLFILALYPTAILLAGTYSYDPWVNAWMYLGLAYLFANIQEKDNYINWKEIFIIIGSLFIAVGPKAIYFPIMILCYFMPKYKFRTKEQRKAYYIIVTIAMLLAVVSFLVPFIFGVSAGTEVGDTRGGTDVNSSLQVRYILSHPLEFAKVLLLFIKDYWSFSNISDYTTNLAYIGTAGNSIFLILGMISTLIIGDSSPVEKNINIKFKIFTVFLVFGISCIVAAAFYVAYTPVGANYLSGCQSRYVLPILFPIAYCLRNTFKPILSKNKQLTNISISSISTIVLVYTLFANIVMIYNIY